MTAVRQPLADRLVAQLVPAARYRSEHDTAVVDGGLYYLVLTDRAGNELAASKRAYRLDEIVARLELLTTVEVELALVRARRMGFEVPGSPG